MLHSCAPLTGIYWFFISSNKQRFLQILCIHMPTIWWYICVLIFLSISVGSGPLQSSQPTSRGILPSLTNRRVDREAANKAPKWKEPVWKLWMIWLKFLRLRNSILLWFLKQGPNPYVLSDCNVYWVILCHMFLANRNLWEMLEQVLVKKCSLILPWWEEGNLPVYPSESFEPWI